jgi:hypothetical protein
VDATNSGSCPLVDFSINDVEPSGYAAIGKQ